MSRRKGGQSGLRVLAFSALIGASLAPPLALSASDDRASETSNPGTLNGETHSYVVSYFHNVLPVEANRAKDCPSSAKWPRGVALEPSPLNYPELFKDYTPEQLKAAVGNDRTIRQRLRSRGPGGADLCVKPELEPQTTVPIPQSGIMDGIDLDGGKRPPGAAKCGHTDLTSPDGRKGIDNGLSEVWGCVEQKRSTGYQPMYEVGLMRDGEYTLLIQIAGIDDLQNDDAVEVRLMAAQDALTKSADGKMVVRDASFTRTRDPRYIHVLKGQILNGVVTTEPKDVLLPSNQHRKEEFYRDARLRLMLQPDGSLRGVMGGYQDIERLWARVRNGAIAAEFASGPYTCPGIWNAMRALADAYPDPKTGQCTAISAAHEIEAVPAFIMPDRRLAAREGAGRP